MSQSASTFIVRRKRIALEGKVFGRLTVLEYIATKKRYNCICECGKNKLASSTDLNKGKVKSCGCYYELFGRYKKYKDSPGKSTYACIYSEYRNSARKRNLAFNLGFDEFINLITSNCYYCNSIPSSYRNRWLDSITKQKRLNTINSNIKQVVIDAATVYVNGVDRVNNSNGYEQNNCRSCCFDCNVAKGTKTEEQFLEWANNLLAHQRRI